MGVRVCVFLKNIRGFYGEVLTGFAVFFVDRKSREPIDWITDLRLFFVVTGFVVVLRFQGKTKRLKAE
jgi:hypothetical protein